MSRLWVPDLATAYYNYRRYCVRPNAIMPIMNDPNDGILFNVMRTDDGFKWGGRPRAEIRFPALDMRYGNQRTKATIAYPAATDHRLTMLNLHQGSGIEMTTPISVETQNGMFRVIISHPTDRTLTVRQEFAPKYTEEMEFYVTRDSVYFNDEQIADFSPVHPDDDASYWKVGCYTDRFDQWPDGVPYASVLYKSLQINVV